MEAEDKSLLKKTKIWHVNWHFQSWISLWCRLKTANAPLEIFWQMTKLIVTATDIYWKMAKGSCTPILTKTPICTRPLQCCGIDIKLQNLFKKGRSIVKSGRSKTNYGRIGFRFDNIWVSFDLWPCMKFEAHYYVRRKKSTYAQRLR